MVRLVILLAAGAITAPAMAQSISFETPAPAPAPETQSKPAAKPAEKLICEKEETIGSRLGASKVCLTEAQWQQKRQEQRETLEKFQQQQRGVGCQNTEGQPCPTGG